MEGGRVLSAEACFAEIVGRAIGDDRRGSGRVVLLPPPAVPSGALFGEQLPELDALVDHAAEQLRTPLARMVLGFLDELVADATRDLAQVHRLALREDPPDLVRDPAPEVPRPHIPHVPLHPIELARVSGELLALVLNGVLARIGRMAT